MSEHYKTESTHMFRAWMQAFTSTHTNTAFNHNICSRGFRGICKVQYSVSVMCLCGGSSKPHIYIRVSAILVAVKAHPIFSWYAVCIFFDIKLLGKIVRKKNRPYAKCAKCYFYVMVVVAFIWKMRCRLARRRSLWCAVDPNKKKNKGLNRFASTVWRWVMMIEEMRAQKRSGICVAFGERDGGVWNRGCGTSVGKIYNIYMRCNARGEGGEWHNSRCSQIYVPTPNLDTQTYLYCCSYTRSLCQRLSHPARRSCHKHSHTLLAPFTHMPYIYTRIAQRGHTLGPYLHLSP